MPFYTKYTPNINSSYMVVKAGMCLLVKTYSVGYLFLSCLKKKDLPLFKQFSI